jgi:hypothetical protein
MKRICLIVLTVFTWLRPSLAQLTVDSSGFRRVLPAAASREAIPGPGRGHPFSAVAVTQIIQTLQDGTHLELTERETEYRDSQGRVRTEIEQRPLGAVITIRDPVDHVIYAIYPGLRIAIRTAWPIGITGSSNRQRITGESVQVPIAVGKPVDPTLSPSTGRDVIEDLGASTINGLYAHGTRETTIFPVGAIGNDHELRSVSEAWISGELNVVVKRIITDPSGTTTHELTDIRLTSPDPALFQVPENYLIQSR